MVWGREEDNRVAFQLRGGGRGVGGVGGVVTSTQTYWSNHIFSPFCFLVLFTVLGTIITWLAGRDN